MILRQCIDRSRLDIDQTASSSLNIDFRERVKKVIYLPTIPIGSLLANQSPPGDIITYSKSATIGLQHRPTISLTAAALMTIKGQTVGINCILKMSKKNPLQFLNEH